MKLQFHKIAKWVAAGIFTLVGIFVLAKVPDVGAVGFTVSPMSQKIIISPGETYKASMTVANPATNDYNIKYKVEPGPFYVDDDNNVVFEAKGDSDMMKDWITFDSGQTGELVPNEHGEVMFTINVPDDAPAGGQYVTLIVTADEASSDSDGDGDGGGNNDGDGRSAMLNQVMRISHLIYAEVTGNTIRQGKILEANVPSFLLSGDITGSAVIKNAGNVHGDANFTMQVYPLFSGEEIYTNEEEPEEHTILPGQTRYEEIAWKQTPAIGIFNVVFTVEFEGVTAQVSKMVIKCPIWLLFIMIFVIFALIFYFVAKAKARKKAAKRTEKTA